MKNPFIWLSGADPFIIERCGELAHSERNKFFGFGTTVIIPAVFGCLALGYAVSTFSPNPWIYIPAGIVWFFTILAIDRFLVSTLYKSRIHKEKSFYFALVLRLFLALVLGIIISHPLVLFLFNESINERIKQDHRGIYSSQSDRFQGKINSTNSSDISLLQEKEDYFQCVRTLQSYEGSGLRKEAFSPKGRSCGASTGKVGCGPGSQCATIYGKRISDLAEEIDKISLRIKNRSAVYQLSIDEVEQEIKKPPSFDYIARTKALENIGNESSHIWWSEKLIILALVLVDCLLVLLKASTPIGAYEIKKDQLFYELDVLSQAEREAIDLYASSAGKESYQSRVKVRATKREMDEVMSIPLDFLKTEDNRMKRFDKALKSAGNRIAPDFILKMRELYVESFNKAAGLVNAFLKS